jgi:UPF0716 protein FxsA
LAHVKVVLFILLFIAVPIVELWLILQIGELLGVLPTIMLLLLDSLLGGWLVRSQGERVWQRFKAATEAGRVPAAEAVDGFLVVLGGTLLIVPGFLSDFLGLLFVLPPTRKPLRGRVIAFVRQRARFTFSRSGMGSAPAGESDLRDFAHSDQPRRPTSSTRGPREPEFDFQRQQIHE